MNKTADKRDSKKKSQPVVRSENGGRLLGAPAEPRGGFQVFTVALIAAIGLWLSFPPIGAWWLAWLAPVPLIWLVVSPQLPGTRPFLQLWLAGLIYWLATFYFIPLPHPALFLGWIVVSAYMAFYTPLFISVSRTLVHRWRIPGVIAVPIAWTGIEWIRCNFATGMAMVCLSHSQFKQPLLIQVADLSGAYTLTFAMALVAAAIAIASMPLLYCRRSDFRPQHPIVSAIVAIAILAAVVGYGWLRLQEPASNLSASVSGLATPDPEQIAHVAIVQTSIDIIFEPPSEAEMTKRFEQVRDLTLGARKQWPDLDLILWPESSFPTPDLLSDLDDTRTSEYFSGAIVDVWKNVTGYPIDTPNSVPILAGSTTHDPAHTAMYNSALLISKPGTVSSRYYKNHRVMFGEYVPFAEWFPKLQEVTPIGRGLTAGTQFETFQIKGVTFTPSICFETTIPHLIRRQINTLAEQGNQPDVLVNLTNDGWFFGTSCLDLHLACNVFRAVEMRKTNLVCANTGLSAEIDSNGRILQVGPRRDVTVLKAEVGKVNRFSFYRLIGDWIPLALGMICLAALIGNRFYVSKLET